jgi:hypothetical protein
VDSRWFAPEAKCLPRGDSIAGGETKVDAFQRVDRAKFRCEPNPVWVVRPQCWNAMIKIDAAKIASHKTDKSPQFLAKDTVFLPARVAVRSRDGG